MPNRIIREDILTSEAVDQLDPAAEVFYRRLMSKVDDHGLYDARLAILKSHLYPLRHDRVREADITRWMAACQKAGLIVLYHHDGKPYLQMMKTKWKARSEPRYPLPAAANNCAQLQTTAPLVVDVVVGVVEDVEEKPASPTAQPDPVAREKTAQGTRLPAGWTLPEDWAAWARGERSDLDVTKQAASFADYWWAKPGKDGRKVNWEATWRNWIRNARPDRLATPAINPAVPRGLPQTDVESKLEQVMGWLSQQRNLGAITDEDYQAKALEARRKYANG